MNGEKERKEEEVADQPEIKVVNETAVPTEKKDEEKTKSDEKTKGDEKKMEGFFEAMFGLGSGDEGSSHGRRSFLDMLGHMSEQTRSPGSGAGCPCGRNHGEEPSAETQLLSLLKAGTSVNLSIERHVEILRRVLDIAQRRELSWSKANDRVYEIQRCLNDANAIVACGSIQQFKETMRSIEGRWPLGRVPHKSYKWALKIVRLVSRERVYQLALI